MPMPNWDSIRAVEAHKLSGCHAIHHGDMALASKCIGASKLRDLLDRRIKAHSSRGDYSYLQEDFLWEEELLTHKHPNNAKAQLVRLMLRDVFLARKLQYKAVSDLFVSKEDGGIAQRASAGSWFHRNYIRGRKTSSKQKM